MSELYYHHFFLHQYKLNKDYLENNQINEITTIVTTIT